MPELEDGAMYICYSTVKRENGDIARTESELIRNIPECIKLRFKDPLRISEGECVTITHYFIKIEGEPNEKDA